MTLVLIALTFFYCVWTTYLWSGMFMTMNRIFRPDRQIGLLNTCWKWCKWPAFVSLFAIPVLQILTSDDIGFWDYAVWLMNIWLWYSHKDSGDDDLTKKFRDKVKEVVAEVQGRLVVVPQGA